MHTELLDNMFNSLYNLEVLDEEDFKKWMQSGTEQYGRGNAVMSVKTFFDWLAGSEEPMQNQT